MGAVALEYAHDQELNIKEPKWLTYLMCVYIFLSYFETYLTVFIGTSTKYFLLGLIGLMFGSMHFKFQLRSNVKMFVAWFLFKLSSVLWASFSSMHNGDFNLHFLSQVGMVMFLLALDGSDHTEHFISTIIHVSFWCSFLFGVLSIFFPRAYINEVYAARQVLTLWGQQNDPNNCAAYLSVGCVLAMYSLIVMHQKRVLNTVVLIVNTIALFMTSSRGGLVTIACMLVLLIVLPNHEDKQHHNGILRKFALTAVLTVVGIWLITKYVPAASFDRLIDFKDYEGGSGRSVRWEVAFDLISQRPIFGWGWGGYNIGFGAIHNTFLTSLCDVGVVGTCLLLSPMINLVVKSIKRRDVLAICLLVVGLAPTLFLDAINKRFFWNSIIIAILIDSYTIRTGKLVKL